MLFNSFSFALFLPLVFILYWLPVGKDRKHWQNAILLVSSYVFYGAWDWRFAILIAFTSLSSYFSGILMERSRPRLWAALNIVVNLGILAFFKYAGFFVDSFRALFNIDGGNTLRIILPVGISFYTFQAIAYTVDVARGSIKASRNPLQFCTFISFFPQLVAGPIERASRLLPQFDGGRRFDYDEAVKGTGLIIWGLMLKILLADRLAVFVDAAWADPGAASGLPALVALLFFAFQLYADFYSYSEIARGVAKLFGVQLMVNFRRPYLSQGFREFWKRWHISLSSWFMDYVYIPLGGNRKGMIRMVLNTVAVFLLSGLWHGADWTFVAWGLLCALFMLLLDKPMKYTARFKLINPPVVFLCWAFSLLLFRAPDFGAALQMLRSIGFGNCNALCSFGLGLSELIAAGAFVVLLIVQEVVAENNSGSLKARFMAFPPVVRWLIFVALVLLLVFLGRYGAGSDSRFIYFQF